MRSECTRKKEHQTISRNQKSNNERPYGHTHHTKRETKHNGVGVAPFDFTGLWTRSFPVTRTNMQRGVFCFHGSGKRVEKGE
jgi:hypothetical protein